jgi:hypothetical protein
MTQSFYCILHQTGRGIDFTNWYKYERCICIQIPILMMEIEEISETLVFNSTLNLLIDRDLSANVIVLTELFMPMWKILLKFSEII